METNEVIWRTLNRREIALIKRMNLNNMKRDEVMSFFVRPGRVISPAVVSELNSKFPDIAAASNDDANIFMNHRIAEASADKPFEGFSPISQIRVDEILAISRPSQAILPGFESHYVEFKRQTPADQVEKAKVIKTLAAFANHDGGYVFLGIENDGTVCGINDISVIDRLFDDIGACLKSIFTPFFEICHGLITISSVNVAVIYTYPSRDKPIMSLRDFTKEIDEGMIYFRYGRSTDRIKAADLTRLLNDRQAG